jgi:hypothetical protein
MTRRRKTERSRGRRRTRGGRCEWIGGRLTAPFFIEDGPEPYRPELALWIEEPSGLVVGQEVIAPEEAEGALGRVLLAAMGGPLAGSPRRPDAIRVADAALAVEVRAALGDAIPVVVAPTPELDALLQVMLESMSEDDEDASYLDGGRISPEVVARFFAATQMLYETAPWEVATNSQVLRLDIPALGVWGACVSIMGNLGESLGLIIFPSDAGYDAFVRAAKRAVEPTHDGRLALGTDWLSLNFERGAELPASMRREVATHLWPVADAEAYPLAACCERDGLTRPPDELDLEIATACAASLCAFFGNHRSLFETDEIKPVCESYYDAEDLEVRFTLPYEAYSHFEIDDDGPAQPVAAPAGRAGPKPGRNAPCPCGSGRKYKKCCLARDRERSSQERSREEVDDLDGRLAYELTEFAWARFGSQWRRFARDFADVPQIAQLVVPWSIYHYRVEGQSVLEAYLEEGPRRLSDVERGWLEAQQAAWLSLWEVSEVEPGVSITLRDLLTDETRYVHEVGGSQGLVARDVLLARIVDHDTGSFLCGLHPRPLLPAAAAEVERRARGRLRRKRAVPVERLRDEAFGRYLIKRWQEAVEDFDVAYAARQTALPEVQNSDGDPLIVTIDHFDIAPGARASVEAHLASLSGEEPPDADESPPVFTFLRPGNPRYKSWDNTIVGHGRLFDTTLQLETNSQARADTLRARVEAVCGDLISHRAREHADPVSAKAAPVELDAAAELSSPEAERLILDFKRRHYADWPDQPLPALGGRTAREAIRTAQGRRDVDVLLKEMEHLEQSAAGGVAFDFAEIRRELGLE